MLNYPLKFEPILKEKIWGGTKLISEFNKSSNAKNIGESWEISDVENNVSNVANGCLKGESLRSLLHRFKSELVGKANFTRFGFNFPLLIKFIDAQKDLSVQVHPNDELSKKRHDSLGKTEMWYIMQADKNARLILGFNKPLTKEEYQHYLENGELETVLRNEQIKKGDAFFIKTGTVHAIGAGVVLAEIQQTSDITYRIYDWDRVDAQGQSRTLHTSLAVDAIDFSLGKASKCRYNTIQNKRNTIVQCAYFTTNFIPIQGEKQLDYSQKDSFVIFMCVEGEATISIFENTEAVKLGETVLIPATASIVTIKSAQCKLLEITI
ncbi:type I phosphomannose isomerase catalytic subunit [Lutibacter sp.]